MMWISRKKYNDILALVKKCEHDIMIQKQDAEILIRNVTKQILEHPDELRKELEDDVKINEFVKEVIFVDGNEKMDGKDVATEKTEQMKREQEFDSVKEEVIELRTKVGGLKKELFCMAATFIVIVIFTSFSTMNMSRQYAIIHDYYMDSARADEEVNRLLEELIQKIEVFRGRISRTGGNSYERNYEEHNKAAGREETGRF